MKNTITILLDKLGVEYTPFYLQTLTEKCNNAQTLSDIKLLLAYYKVDSLAVQIGREELSEIPLPALVLSAEEDENGKVHNDYFVLESLEDEKVSLISPKGEKKSVIIEDFEKSWTGYTLLLDKNKNSKEPNYLAHKKAEQKQKVLNTSKTIVQVLVVASLLFIIGNSLFSSGNFSISSLFEISFYLLHGIGFVLSAILLSGEIFKDNVVFKKACTAFGNSSSCADTTNTDKTTKIDTLKNWFTFSELGVYYFFGGFLFLLISNAFGLFIQSLIAVLGIVAVITSLYYQKFVLKTWCSLCVSVMAVLSVQAILGGIFLSVSDAPNITTFTFISALSIFLFAFLLPTLVWNVLKPIFTKYNSYKNKNQKLHSFKYDFELFQTLLSQSRKIDTTHIPTHFVEGNDVSVDDEEEYNKVSLVVISRPTCPPCKTAKKDLQKLRESFGNYFTTTTCHLTMSQKNEDYKQISEMLSDLPTPYSESEKESIISEHYAWINQQGITFTPAFIVNGRLLPENYRVSDLEYFLVHLANEMDEVEENKEEQLSL
ncbi:cysteine peptidase family C39 domain-containing protein [Bernardetia sp.]|uniref:cysteine peptidase family C39 domain-containing protein n=1 Tax=Bernardetia sp. TaxID=1937974 RepID=UPI0025BBF88D|nr:cysteine peptidase family C39 domain-containing protein [Bernardetia sp.]